MNFRLFLSYAHDDNDFPEEWVDVFYTQLTNRLKTLISKDKIEIWRDTEDRIGNNLEDSLKKPLDQTDFLIALVSPTYLSKYYCTLEREYFLNKVMASRGVSREEAANDIFNVVKVKNGIDEIPEELSNQFRHDFFVKETNVSYRELEYVDDKKPYRKLINQLAFEILHRCKEREEENQAADTDETVVYLSVPSGDVYHYRKKLRDELVKMNYLVVPNKRLPSEPEEAKKTIATFLQKAQLSVHFFGKEYGDLLEGKEKSIQALQYEIAADEFEEQPLIAWIDESVSEFDEQQGKFTQEVQRSDYSDNIDVQIAPFQMLRTNVMDQLTDLDNL